MGTRFEIVLVREPCSDRAGAARLRASGEAALDEIREWHDRLTRFEPQSFVSHLGRTAVHEPVALDADMFALAHDALSVWRDSEGAFDVTVAPIMADRGFAASAVAPARASVGSHAISLDGRTRTIAFSAPLSLDFGAIGKGHALECAAAVLRRCGIERAFLHGGTSSGLALGRGPDGQPWRVALDADARVVIDLSDEGFSVSDTRAQRGQDGTGHILDPRNTGVVRRSDARRPAGYCHPRLSSGLKPAGYCRTPQDRRTKSDSRVAVTGPSARLADAWSTALSVLGEIPPAFPKGYTARWL
jgi:thiamine biosynthesis lipoprotein